MQEEEILFKVIKNRPYNYDNFRTLINLKQIFSLCLPKMPRAYILKLLFCPNHESLLIYKKIKISEKIEEEENENGFINNEKKNNQNGFIIEEEKNNENLFINEKNNENYFINEEKKNQIENYFIN